MLRPATPLSILFFVAFVLLLLSTLSTPIIKAIPLAEYQGVKFGVLGFCKDNGQCSGITVGYSTDGLFSTGENGDGDFSLPEATRHSLSAILIVHPVAALLTLICFILAVAAHFHGPAHSPRYLLALLILTFPTLLVTLLAFLVDLLLFVPHVQWGGWIVLAATIIITASGIVTCAMRRTLVSRKARKKRIAENAEMNGENYYAQREATVATEALPKAESPPPLSAGTLPGSADKGPDFATFDLSKQSTDDRQPLNPRNPSIKSGHSNGGTSQGRPSMESARFNDQNAPPMPMGRGRGPPRDQYGNPMVPPREGFAGPPGVMGRQNSDGTMNSSRSGGPPPMYGPGRGRGGYGPRGGYGAPRGGYGPGRGGPQGMRGPPPPGWNGRGRGGPPGGMVMMGGRGRGPPPGYDPNGRYYGGPAPNREPSPYGAPRDMSPAPPMMNNQPMAMPIGQAVEMDALNGTTPPRSPLPPAGGMQNYGLRESDGDVQGMIALQGGPPMRRDSNSNGPASPGSSSVYSPAEYVPPRAAWAQHRDNSDPSTATLSNNRGLSPIQASPVELAAPHSPTHAKQTGHNRTLSSDDYYEDVEPRFAQPTELPVSQQDSSNPSTLPSSATLPTALVAGYGSEGVQRRPSEARHQGHLHPSDHPPMPAQLERDSSYEDMSGSNSGARSPAASEASNFTSVSQRGVNPNWRPGPGGRGDPTGQYPPYSGPGGPRQRNDGVLEANPDFSLPGMGPPRSRPGFAGRGRGGMMPQPPPSQMQGGLGAVQGAGGRYPGPADMGTAI